VSKGQLKPALASLFNVDSSDIQLQAVDGGLTHQTRICRVSGQCYFVKIYLLGGDVSRSVANINRLTSFMRSRGVPASRIALYSPELANIVVHEFVEGEMANGDISQAQAIAKLYSQVALIGVERGKSLTKIEYLSELNSYLEILKNMEGSGIKTDASIHSSTLNLAGRTLNALQDSLPDQDLFHIYMHDDFTEKNILMDGDQVKLLCDWDSFRLKLLAEHLACAACRFSTDRPLAGVLQEDKLSHFLQSLNPKVPGYISSIEEFAQLFPLLATLKHLRTYYFRNSVIHLGRADLRTPLLEWPLEHCLWLMDNQQQVSDWVLKALAEHVPQASPKV